MVEWGVTENNKEVEMATFTVVLDTTHIDEVRRQVREHEKQGWHLTHTEGRWFEHTFTDEAGYKAAVREYNETKVPGRGIPVTLKSQFTEKAPAYTGFLIYDGPA